MIIGIDPGVHGAIAILWDDDNNLEVYDTPIFILKKGKKANVVCDIPGMAAIIKPQVVHKCVAYIEKAHTMPGQGVVSQGKFMESYGIWRGILAGIGIPYTEVSPQTWKKKIMPDMDRSSKDAARYKASQTWPELPYFSHKKDEHRAEAALIALYGFKMQRPSYDA